MGGRSGAIVLALLAAFGGRAMAQDGRNAAAVTVRLLIAPHWVVTGATDLDFRTDQASTIQAATPAFALPPKPPRAPTASELGSSSDSSAPMALLLALARVF